MLYSLSDIEAQTSAQLFDQGWRWFVDGKVTAPSVQRGGEIVSAVIHQTTRRPLRVYVRTYREGGTLTLQGECTCSRQRNCEHVAAVLLQALADRGELPDKPGNSSRVRNQQIEPATDSGDGTVQSSQALLYLLRFDGDGPAVATLVARRRRNGDYTPGRPFDPARALRGTPARFLQPVDLELLAALQRLPRHCEDACLLRGSASDHLLQALLATEHLQLLDDEQERLIPLRRGNPRPVQLQWLADEAQVVRELDARHRLCLTGTPMENHLGELWSLFDVLLPGLLGDHKSFRRWFRTPIEKRGDEAASERLRQRIRPFLLRRTKQQVATELPDKTEISHTVALEGRQRELYETVRLAMHSRVREEIERQGLARSQIVVLDALLKLRQVCCDPRLIDSERARAVGASAKLEMLLQLLPEMVEEGRRILLFSQFTGMLALIEDAVSAAGIDYVKLTGRTRDRQTPVQRFQRGEVPLFLISLKAGGVGLNLTAADTVIHYDPWWNPAVERQATDRAHRIGQQRAVFVYKLICAGTVEEKIQQMQQRKQALADGLYDKSGRQEPRWRGEDLDALFAPLDETAGSV